MTKSKETILPNISSEIPITLKNACLRHSEKVKECFKDSDGYWIFLRKGYINMHLAFLVLSLISILLILLFFDQNYLITKLIF